MWDEEVIKPSVKPRLRIRKQFRPKEHRKAARIVLSSLATLFVLAAFGYVANVLYVSYKEKIVRDSDLRQAEILSKKEAIEKANRDSLTRLDESNGRIAAQWEKKQERDYKYAEKLAADSAREKAKLDQANREVQEARERQIREEKEKQNGIEAEARRNKLEADRIEQDHQSILAYRKIYIKGSFQNLLWSHPSRAISSDGESGRLYKLQGTKGDYHIPISLYFLVINREVVRWQDANKPLKICHLTDK